MNVTLFVLWNHLIHSPLPFNTMSIDDKTSWFITSVKISGNMHRITTEFMVQSYFLKLNARHTVYPKKYAHGFCFAVLCCGYTLTDFPISIRLTSLALWQSNDCPSASKATLMNMDKYFMWIHYERLHNHNKAKHNKTVCIFLGIYCTCTQTSTHLINKTIHWILLLFIIHVWIDYLEFKKCIIILNVEHISVNERDHIVIDFVVISLKLKFQYR